MIKLLIPKHGTLINKHPVFKTKIYVHFNVGKKDTIFADICKESCFKYQYVDNQKGLNKFLESLIGQISNIMKAEQIREDNIDF